MKLHEIAQDKNVEINQWFKDNLYGGDALHAEINSDGSANLIQGQSDFSLLSGVQEILYPINKVTSDWHTGRESFIVQQPSSLTSAKNVPRHCRRISLTHVPLLKSLEGLDLHYCDWLDVYDTGMTDWRDIFPHLTCDLRMLSFGELRKPLTSLVGVKSKFKIENIQLFNADFTEGGLGLLLIPGLKTIKFNSTWPASDNCRHALTIIAKYAGRPDDIFECQTELIENGYEEFAIL